MTIYDGFKKPDACIINAPKDTPRLRHLQIPTDTYRYTQVSPRGGPLERLCNPI